MNLTTLAKVKELLRSESALDGSVDAQLNRLIAYVSGRAEKLMDRTALKGSKTEQMDVNAGQYLFLVQAPPIVSVTSIKNAFDRDFATASVLDTDWFTFYPDETGRIEVLGGLVAGPRVLQVVYTGGMGTTVDDFVTNYPDLSDALALEVCHHWNHMPSLGIESRGTGTDVVHYRQLSFLPDVYEMVMQYKRWTF